MAPLGLHAGMHTPATCLASVLSFSLQKEIPQALSCSLDSKARTTWLKLSGPAACWAGTLVQFHLPRLSAIGGFLHCIKLCFLNPFRKLEAQLGWGLPCFLTMASNCSRLSSEVLLWGLCFSDVCWSFVRLLHWFVFKLFCFPLGLSPLGPSPSSSFLWEHLLDCISIKRTFSAF